MRVPYHCADPNFGHFSAQGSKWEKRDLTYGFVETTSGLGDARARLLMREAFDEIEAVCNLKFTVQHSGNPDITIRFVRGDHGDGNPFTGAGGTLAHAWYPIPNSRWRGDIHFDAAEQWRDDGRDFDFKTVAMHEALHSLGIAHSNVEGSIMEPFYDGPQGLHQDDKDALRSLYGAPVPPAPPPEPEPPSEPGEDGWCPFAGRFHGPPEKRGGYRPDGAVGGPKRGEVKHSAVGSWDGMKSVLLGTRKVSWHFSVLKSGLLFQHYPVDTDCWHANDSDPDDGISANLDTVGVEHEGGPPGNESEPLTDAQLATTIRLSKWLMDYFGFESAGRFPDQVNVWTLVEHNQVGNTPTACPSNRIPWDTILRNISDTPAPPPEPPQTYTHEQEMTALASLTYHLDQQARGFPTESSVSDFSKGVIRRIVEMKLPEL